MGQSARSEFWGEHRSATVSHRTPGNAPLTVDGLLGAGKVHGLDTADLLGSRGGTGTGEGRGAQGAHGSDKGATLHGGRGQLAPQWAAQSLGKASRGHGGVNWGGRGGDGSREERGSSGKGVLAVLCSPFSLRPQKPQEGLNFRLQQPARKLTPTSGGRQRICGARWWGEAIGGMLVGQAAVGDATQPLANGPGFVCDGGATLSGGPRCFLCCPPAWPAMFGVSAPWVIRRPRPGFDAAASAQQTGPPDSSILTSVMVNTVTIWRPASEAPIGRRRRRQVPLNSPARSNGNVMHGYNQPKRGIL